jgi:hypothetical protein
LRVDNWTFFGIPTARIVTLGFLLVGVIGLIYRHGPGRPAETAADLLPDHSAGTVTDDEAAFWSDETADDDDDADDDDADDDDADDDDADDDDADDGADSGADDDADEADADEADTDVRDPGRDQGPRAG